MVPRPPYELIDAIAAILMNDQDNKMSRTTLSSMSLTCHAWLHLARSHLFKDVSKYYDKIEPFLAFLHTDSGMVISGYVRSLYLYTGSSDPDVSTIPLLVLKSLLSKLAHLQSLTLNYLWFEWVPGDEGDSDMQRDPTDSGPRVQLERLCVQGLGNPCNVADFFAFMDISSNVNILELHNIFWRSDDALYDDQAYAIMNRYGEDILPHLRVKHLAVWNLSIFATVIIFETLQRSASVHARTLTALDVNLSLCPYFTALNRFCREYGSQLLDLTLNIVNDMHSSIGDDGFEASALSACTSLRSLELRLNTFTIGRNTGSSVWLSTVSLLVQLSPTITHIRLHIRDYLEDFLEDFNICEGRLRLDDILMRLPQLELVVLRMNSRKYSTFGRVHLTEDMLQEVHDVLEKALPKMYRRGVLDLTCL